VYSAGSVVPTALLRLYLLPNAVVGQTRLGVVASKRVNTKATARNAIKRATKHWIQKHLPEHLRDGYDIVVVVKQHMDITRSNTRLLYKHLETAVSKWHIQDTE
jgi:ribonuclease P protein component